VCSFDTLSPPTLVVVVLLWLRCLFFFPSFPSSYTHTLTHSHTHSHSHSFFLIDIQCDEAPDQRPGDLTFVLTTLQHPMFTRDNADLKMEMSISLLDALVGFEKHVVHLDGHAVTVKRSAVTIPGLCSVLSCQVTPSVFLVLARLVLSIPF
jgi:DnaJ C terminal domain